MRSIQVVFAIVFMFSAAQAFAHHEDKNGPCKSYIDTCKEDPSVTSAIGKKAKHKAMHACVAAAAKTDAANGQKCVDAMAKHKKEHAMHDEAAPAAGT
jgi:hypothetical protein